MVEGGAQDAPFHTGVVALAGPDTAIAVNERCPSETARAIAACSAQMVTLNDTFSTFTPVITVPSVVASAAPTSNRE